MTKEFSEQVEKYLPNINPNKRFSQEHLADILGIDPSQLSRVRSGSRGFRAQLATDVAEKLMVPSTELAEFLLKAVSFRPDVIARALEEYNRLRDLATLEPNQAILLMRNNEEPVRRVHTFYIVGNNITK